MFYDKVKIFIQSGNGGNGMVSFRREKHVPKGGPNGGNGGNGGSVYIIGDKKITTMVNFRYKKIYKALNGEKGKSNNMSGKKGEDIFLKVPLGTIIKDEHNNILEDIINSNQQILILKGGRGGKGNTSFMTNKNKAPIIAENGEPGEKKIIYLELKLLADVGLLGYPNVGKSTFISNISNAKSKIDNYPFTTIEPKLGIVNVNKNKFVLADIPGLIEGANKGVGLGHKFLKHLERTKIILHILDAGASNRNLFEDYKKIRKELLLYNKFLTIKKEIIVINKIDLPGSEKKANQFIKMMYTNGYSELIYKISALNKKGIKILLNKISLIVRSTKNLELNNKNYKVVKLINNNSDVKIQIEEKTGFYIITGNIIEKILKMSYLNSNEGLVYFYKRLKKLGIIDLLKSKGIKTGDTVEIGKIKFDFIE